MSADTIFRKIPDSVIFGQSEAMGRVRSWLLRAASTDVSVLILGESGTGKEVIANALHAHSRRSLNPFAKVNCPAIPGTLLESELFGYQQGAFTGAYEAKAGLIESAESGTLFLDEIGEMELSLQAKLLQFLQDATYVPLGGQGEKRANVRIVCATNRRLDNLSKDGTFRSDLFYRMSVLPIEIPPLRRRRADIPILVEYFMKRYQDEYGLAAVNISPALMQLFLAYNWPGNVRELENVIKRYVILGSEDVVVNDLLGREARIQIDGETSLKTLTRKAVRDLEQKIILSVLHDNNWNRKRAAQILKISYRTLFYKIKDGHIPQKRNRLRKASASPENIARMCSTTHP
jgi:two-component system response regulator AtoC